MYLFRTLCYSNLRIIPIQINSLMNHSGESENHFNWFTENNWLKSMICSKKSNIITACASKFFSTQEQYQTTKTFEKCIFTTEMSMTFKIWLISMTFPGQESTILKLPDISRSSMTMKMGDFLLLKNWIIIHCCAALFSEMLPLVLVWHLIMHA